MAEQDVKDTKEKAQTLLQKVVKAIPRSILYGGALLAPAFFTKKVLNSESNESDRAHSVSDVRNKIVAAAVHKVFGDAGTVINDTGGVVPHDALSKKDRTVFIKDIGSASVGGVLGGLYGSVLGARWQKYLDDKGDKVLINRRALMTLVGSAIGGSLGHTIFHVMRGSALKKRGE